MEEASDVPPRVGVHRSVDDPEVRLLWLHRRPAANRAGSLSTVLRKQQVSVASKIQRERFSSGLTLTEVWNYFSGNPIPITTTSWMKFTTMRQIWRRTGYPLHIKYSPNTSPYPKVSLNLIWYHKLRKLCNVLKGWRYPSVKPQGRPPHKSVIFCADWEKTGKECRVIKALHSSAPLCGGLEEYLCKFPQKGLCGKDERGGWVTSTLAAQT